MIARFDEIDAVRCPCGFSRRAFVNPDNPTATMHIVDIEADAQVHYHKKLTEIYFVLEGEGEMELDSKTVPVKPYTAIFNQARLPPSGHRKDANRQRLHPRL